MGFLVLYRKIKPYKYMLADSVTVDLPPGIVPVLHVYSPDYANMVLTIDAKARTLYIAKGYCWDGASGPTIDTKNTMLPALVHDALYQFMREGKLPQNKRKAVDQLFYRMLKEAGMSNWRAKYYYWGVRAAGAPSAKRQRTQKYRTYRA